MVLATSTQIALTQTDQVFVAIMASAMGLGVPIGVFLLWQKRKSKAEAEAPLYAKVFEELTKGQWDEGLWFRSLAQCNGDEKQAQALYSRIRVAQLASEAQKASRLPEASVDGLPSEADFYCMCLQWGWPISLLLAWNRFLTTRNIIHETVLPSFTVPGASRTVRVAEVPPFIATWIQFDLLLTSVLVPLGVYFALKLKSLYLPSLKWNRAFMLVCAAKEASVAILSLAQEQARSVFFSGPQITRLVESVFAHLFGTLEPSNLFYIKIGSALIALAWWLYLRLSKRLEDAFW